MRLLGRLWRFVAAVAAPVLVALLLLYFGRPESMLGEVPAPKPRLDVQAPQAERMIALRLQYSDGRPAAGAVVLLTAPDPAYAEAGADGIARLRIPASGDVAFYAYAHGMEILDWGPAPDPPLSAVRFSAVPEIGLSGVEPAARVAASLLLTAEDGEPLAGALAILRRAGHRNEVPWVGICGPDGRLEFEALPEAEMEAEIHAPGMPPSDAALLGRIRFDPRADGPTSHLLPAAWLVIPDLEPDALLRLERLDRLGSFPIGLVPSDGVARLGPLPPGEYRLTAGESVLALTLQPQAPPSR